MVQILYGKNFLKSAKILPKEIRNKLAEQIGLINNNPFNPLLHTKYLSGALVGLFSFRITRDWRVIFVFLNSETISLIDIAHRKDIYR